MLPPQGTVAQVPSDRALPCSHNAARTAAHLPVIRAAGAGRFSAVLAVIRSFRRRHVSEPRLHPEMGVGATERFARHLASLAGG